MISDSFHDFFTEYIPFGEDAVSYFEEREFHKRFPKAAQRVSTKPRETGEKVTIPSKSGISWKVADSKDKGSTEGQKKASGTPDKPASDKKPVSRAQEGKQHPLDATAGEKTAVVEEVKAGAKATSPKVKSTEDKQRTQSEVSKPKETKFEAKSADPESESTKARVVAAIDPLTIKDASEPVLQDLVKIINDIIAVVNADAASPSPSSNYSSAIESAKTSLADVGRKITSLKEAEKAQAEQTIKASHEDFDRAAKELVRRLEEEMLDQESRWKDDFEAEREKISQSYQSKIQTELAREKELAEQRLENELLEQAIVLKRQFASDVKAQVEAERSGRLSKLSELSSSVSELEKLTTDWTSVVDANLQTQHLHVAVEAMRAHLDDPNTNHPTPFIRELAALKEVAADDPVVHAAIASINPIAYQRGVPSSAQLIDRFRRVAAEVRKAALLPEDAGVASHAASVVLSKVLFKKSGAVAGGDDVESVLTRTETLLEEGDVDAAAREMNGLKGWAKVLSRDWLAEARRVLEVKQALDVSLWVCFLSKIIIMLTRVGHCDRSEAAEPAARLDGETALSLVVSFVAGNSSKVDSKDG